MVIKNVKNLKNSINIQENIFVQIGDDTERCINQIRFITATVGKRGRV